MNSGDRTIRKMMIGTIIGFLSFLRGADSGLVDLRELVSEFVVRNLRARPQPSDVL
jgi:hypothetical protein